ncbi:hypothetical protein [Duganella lactea]|nr:hypothetical protein [Duganella lactea]
MKRDKDLRGHMASDPHGRRSACRIIALLYCLAAAVNLYAWWQA